MQKHYLLLILTISLESLHAQGAFQNLDFESATVPARIPGQPAAFVPITEATPGWRSYNEEFELTSVLHDGFSTGGSFPSILDPAYNSSFVIDGQYTIGLSASGSAGGDLSIAQTGFIPANSRSILFKAALLSGSSFSVFLGGVPLTAFPLQTGPNYIRYGVDISAFAGQTEELRFTLAAAAPGHGLNAMLLDTIQFSPVSIPEPGSITILLAGITVFGLSRRRRLWRGRAM
jgi:hypothetical protein